MTIKQNIIAMSLGTAVLVAVVGSLSVSSMRSISNSLPAILLVDSRDIGEAGIDSRLSDQLDVATSALLRETLHFEHGAKQGMLQGIEESRRRRLTTALSPRILGTGVAVIVSLAAALFMGMPDASRMQRLGDAAPAVSHAIHLRGLRALAAHHNPEIREHLRSQLCSWGIEAATASTGEEAMKLLLDGAEEARPFHLAILDTELPDTGALELGKAIKARGETAATVLLVLLPIDGCLETSQLESAGFSGHLVCPVRQSRLYDLIQDATAPPFAIDDLLERCMGDAEMVGLILDEFEKQADANLHEINQNVVSGNVEAVARAAHSLKGACGILAAGRLASIARELEQLGTSGSLQQAMPLLSQLNEEVHRCVAHLPVAREAMGGRPAVEHAS